MNLRKYLIIGASLAVLAVGANEAYCGYQIHNTEQEIDELNDSSWCGVRGAISKLNEDIEHYRQRSIFF